MTNPPIKKNLPAYTLIEMLVVLAIIGITSTILLVDWSGNRTIQYLDSSGGEVQAIVRSAQNYALTGVQGVAATQPCSFRIQWSGSSYQIMYYYKNGGACGQLSTLSSYTLANGVTFDSAGSFDFTVPYATVSGSQTIPLVKLGVNHVVCVYTSGRINHVTGPTCP